MDKGGAILGYRGGQVIAYIAAEIDRSGRPPSYAMIAKHLGMTNAANVCHVVRRLEKRGLLKRNDTGSRHRRGWHQPVIEIL